MLQTYLVLGVTAWLSRKATSTLVAKTMSKGLMLLIRAVNSNEQGRDRRLRSTDEAVAHGKPVMNKNTKRIH